jgi:hypothetical protein
MENLLGRPWSGTHWLNHAICWCDTESKTVLTFLIVTHQNSGIHLVRFCDLLCVCDATFILPSSLVTARAISSTHLVYGLRLTIILCYICESSLSIILLHIISFRLIGHS